MSFGPRGGALRRRILAWLPTRLWMWTTLPLAAFAGLRVTRLDETGCSVRLPGGWRTRNPFRSTYFAAQAMAAEMSTGAPALVLLADAPASRDGQADSAASVALLVVDVHATYSKKVVGPSVFTFEDVAGMKALIDEASRSDEPRRFVARSVGRDTSNDVVAEIEVAWSFKRRSRS